jgi:hypothetical protein
MEGAVEGTGGARTGKVHIQEKLSSGMEPSQDLPAR